MCSVPLGRVLERIPPVPAVGAFRIALESVESWTGTLASAAEAQGSQDGEGAAFNKGSILFGKLRPYLAKVWVADRAGVFYGDFIHLKPKHGGDPRYFGYVLRTRDVIDAANAEATGSKMPRTEWERLRTLTISAPPSTREQQQIADYLDHETAEIDTFIGDLQTAAALVRERASAELERLVWPSAVEGVPLRRFLRSIDQGVSPVADAHPAGPGEIGVLKAGCTNEGVFNVDANKRLLSEADVPASALVHRGELVVTRASGSTRHVGSAAIVPTLDRVLAMSDKHYRLRANRYADVEYLQAVMQTHRFRADLEPRISGAIGLAKNISIGQLVSVLVPNVPRAAQVQAAAAVAHRREEVSPTLADFEAAIALAKERRAAVITAAVTGQFDVTERKRPVVDSIQTAIEEAR